MGIKMITRRRFLTSLSYVGQSHLLGQFLSSLSLHLHLQFEITPKAPSKALEKLELAKTGSH